MLTLEFSGTYPTPPQWVAAGKAPAKRIMAAHGPTVLPTFVLDTLQEVTEYRRLFFDFKPDAFKDVWFGNGTKAITRRTLLAAASRLVMPSGDCEDFQGHIPGDLLAAGFRHVGFYRMMIMVQRDGRNGHLTGMAHTSAGHYMMDVFPYTYGEFKRGVWRPVAVSVPGSMTEWQRVTKWI